MKIYIILENLDGKKSYSFDDKLLIGRSDKCQLKLNDDLSSGNHCLLIMRGSDLCVEDMNSKNGTYINNIRIMSSRLCMNDILKVGNSTIRLDPLKNSDEVKKLLRYEGSYQRDRGELTLELENVDHIRKFSNTAKKEMKEGNFKVEKKQSDFVKNSKLYEGADTFSPNEKDKMSKAKLTVKTYLASLIDNFITLLIFLIPVLVFKMSLGKDGVVSAETLKSTSGLIALLIGGISAIVFRKWNLKRQSTVGEVLFKL